MSAYIMAFVRIEDLEAYNREYAPYAYPLLTKYGGKPFVVSENVRVVEGALPQGKLVIVEFPSTESAEAFYADPDYQPLIEVRQRLSSSDAAIFDKGLESAEL